jgi:hypothetical protein
LGGLLYFSFSLFSTAQTMELLIGGKCAVCSYTRMFVVNGLVDKLAFQCCPNCTFTYNRLGELDFQTAALQINCRLSRLAAIDEVQKAGIYEDEEREFHRDPFHSLVADFTKMFHESFTIKSEQQQRMYLLVNVSANAERLMDVNICDPPAALVSRFRSSNPPIINR